MSPANSAQSDIEVQPSRFGGNVFGWSADEATSFKLLDRFVDAGLDLIDTADGYSAWVPGNSGGESETIIGNWLRRSGRREDVVIATKVAKWSKHPGLSPDNVRPPPMDRWPGSASNASTCTRRTRKTRPCRSRKRLARFRA